MKGLMGKGIALALTAVLLSGCGEEMLPLTEDEQAIIVSYSAGAVSKNNKRQQEGLTIVYQDEEEQDKSTDEAASEEAAPEEDQGSGDQSSGDQSSGNQASEDQSSGGQGSGDQAQGAQGSGDQGQAQAPQEPPETTLTDAIGIPGLTFDYRDYSVSASYAQGDYFSMDASPGSTFLILNINVTNTTDQAVECGLLAKQPVFTLEINGSETADNQVTMLENDLSTYMESIEPGETAAAVLLFETPEATAGKVSSLRLKLEMGGATSMIPLGK